VPGAETVSRGGFVLPGLVDAHCHVGVARGGGHVETLEGLREQALAERDAGVLALRDCGSPVDTRALDDEPDLPRIIRAGRHLARTRRYLPGLGIELEPEDLVAEVRVQARRGDGWVKLVGDWIDRGVGDLAPEWPADVVAAAIAAAHAEGAKVTAHTFGTDALPDLIRAGIDCVEHGTGLTEELIGEMAARGTAVVPTLVNVQNFPGFAEAGEKRFPQYASTMRRLYASSGAVVRAAYEAGVPVFAGTDAGGGIDHGRVADEIRALAAAGLPAEAALAGGSWAARTWLGLPNVVDGAPADLVVYDADPRLDLDVLARPSLTVLRGRVYR
jgi:imidazolonepropionase-like amidohydrolase